MPRVFPEAPSWPELWPLFQCSVTCGAGIRQRSALCINDTDVPCKEVERPVTEVTCLLPPCPRPMYMTGTDGSGSGSSSPELFNEVDFIPHRPAPRPSPASSPKPASISNAIDEEDLELDPPGPVFVDDFYYDYNFINFHEDLSYGSFEEPHPDPVDAGGWTASPHIRSTEPTSDAPVPTSGTPEVKEEGLLGAWSPSPSLIQASHPPPVFLEQTPVNPLANFLSEDDIPMEVPEVGLPSLPWPPASADGMATPVAPGNPDELLVREDRQDQSPTPWSNRNKVSKDEDTLGQTSPALPHSPIPTQPSSFYISTIQASPGPDVVEEWTEGPVAWDPVSEGDLKPVHGEQWPTVEVVPPLLHPLATVPSIWDRDSPMEPGTPTFSAPELGSQNSKTLTFPGTSLWTAPTDLSSPGPGQPQPPNPEGTLSSVPLPRPAQETYTNSSKDPEIQPLQPSLVEDESPTDPLPGKNATWQVGNWSQVSCVVPGMVGSLSRTLGLKF